MRSHIDPLQQVDRVSVRWRGRKYLFFGGCDYFRLSSHPRILAALKKGLDRFGLSVAASRTTTGEHVLYQRFESRLAQYFGAPTATIMSSGYIANIGVGQALAGKYTHALIDERSHLSLWDAAAQLGCPVRRYRHRDVHSFERLMARCGSQSRPIVLTDGMFSHDGSVAPLKQILRHLPSGGAIMVDDAHGAGVLGQQGRGAIEHEGVSRSRIIQTITLSKAFGVCGGAILGSEQLRKRIILHSRIFAGSTPMPLPLVNAAIESLNVLRRGSSMRQRLWDGAARLRALAAAKSYPVEPRPGPILRIELESERAVRRLRSRLVKAGIYPSYMHYPGWPGKGCFRFVVSSEHSQRHLDSLAESL